MLLPLQIVKKVISYKAITDANSQHGRSEALY